MDRLSNNTLQKEIAHHRPVTFIITSVISFSDNKLSYSDKRSVFSPEERISQTLRTISTIRDKVPQAKIILVELGNLPQDHFKMVVDHYLFLGKKFKVRHAVKSKHKGLGEAIGLLFALRNIKQLSGICFKISGRYFLNDKFNIDDWQQGKFCCKVYSQQMSTRLYSVVGTESSEWVHALKKSIYKLWKGHSIEEVLYNNIAPATIHPIETLGISGFIAPDGVYITE